MIDHVLGLECLVCGKRYGAADVDYVCPDHGTEGIVDVLYDYDAISRSVAKDDLAANPDRTIWRYRPLLPVAAASPAPWLPVGGTPLWRLPGEHHGLRDVWVKDDTRNPTASFKDRASAMAVVKAREVGAEVITTASTGNAAAALGGLCAAQAIPAVIFVPKTAPQAKVAQLLAYGATVMLVDGTYDVAFELCLDAASAFGWYNRNTGYNPYMSEGKKTAAYEICEQLGWSAPDAVVVSVGDGCIIGGLYKGFFDLLSLGWIDRMPRLIGVQAAGSNYLASAWMEGADVVTKPAIVPNTVADSISAGLPRDRIKAMRAVVKSDGGFVTCDDAEILAAIPALAAATGVFAEPAAAAAYAGLVGAAAEDLVDRDDRVVVVVTGSGLKDVPAAMRSIESADRRPHHIAPTLDAVADALGPMVPGA